jgi:protein-S-isoprenylcysteine O-methyltransferase Ste14
MRATVPAYLRPLIEDPQAFALILTIWLYGASAGLMLLRARWKYGHGIGLVPRERFERWLWLACVPLLVVWILMPGLALKRRHEWLVIPELVRHDPVLFWVRWLAAAGAMLSLVVVVGCWWRMGQSWRVAVMPGEKTALVTDGLYATIRHPIYAFNIVLVLCSIVVVPTIPMVLVATPLIGFMLVKARREERFMRETHGQIYIDYCDRTGRFFPRRGSQQEAQ